MTDPLHVGPRDTPAEQDAGESAWPPCATYPHIACVCRSGLGSKASTCTRKRTGDLTPTRRAEPDAGYAAVEPDTGDLLRALLKSQHGCRFPEPCSTCASLARAILASDWLANRVREAEQRGAETAAERIAQAIDERLPEHAVKALPDSGDAR